MWGPRRPGVFPLLIYNHGSRPGQERHDDVLAGLNHLQSRGIFDSERVAMIGASLGGTVSILAASKAPERFSAVVSQAAGVGIGRGQIALDMGGMSWSELAEGSPPQF